MGEERTTEDTNRICNVDADAPGSVPSLEPCRSENEQQDQTQATTTTNSLLRVVMRREILLLLLVSFAFALGISGVVGVIPDTIADRYARLRHGHTGPACDSFAIKPEACQAGTEDAEAAATWSNVGLSFLGLVLNPVVGTISDVYGRRCTILASIFVSCISSLLFLCTIVSATMDPMWYYISSSVSGGFQYLGLAFAALSDVVEDEYRAGSFGVLLAVMYGGFAFAPSIPLFLSHHQTTWVCTALLFLILIAATILLPETLSSEIQKLNLQQVQATSSGASLFGTISANLTLPKISVLNRNWTIRIVAAGALISSMVYACDGTFVLYYIEDRLNFGDFDIARLFLYIGVFGVVLQGTALQPLVKLLGEKNLLVLTFLCGVVHNLLYGVAKSKRMIYVAVILSQFTKVNFPVLASLASQVSPATEQGRIQGAISACTSLGAAAGPVSAELVHGWAKRRWGYGPEFMFIYASALYMIGTGLMILIPRQSRSRNTEVTVTVPSNETLLHETESAGGLEEPLLSEQEQTA